MENIQGVPKKVTEFYEISPDIFGQENQFKYFCGAGKCSYLTGKKIFDTFQDGVSCINDTKSVAEFFYCLLR